MTTFKCALCGDHWTQGPTRDMRLDKVCTTCLEKRIEKLREGVLEARSEGCACDFHLFGMDTDLLTNERLDAYCSNEMKLNQATSELTALSAWSCSRCGARFSNPVPEDALEGVDTCSTCAQNEILAARIRQLLGQVDSLVERKEAAYDERDRLVAFLSKLLPASLEPHQGLTWGPRWGWVVSIDSHAGQLDWHIPVERLGLVAHLPRAQGRAWDGTTREEKYHRMEAAAPLVVAPLAAVAPLAHRLRSLLPEEHDSLGHCRTCGCPLNAPEPDEDFVPGHAEGCLWAATQALTTQILEGGLHG